MDIERDGNLVEAGVWFVVAALVFWKALRAPVRVKRTLLWLGSTLAIFGASDIVESRTGAWWRPWWLLAWKAVCVIALLFLFVSYFRSNKAHKNETPDAK